MSRLGCATDYTAVLHWQGGAQRYLTLNGVNGVGWERKLNDVSQSQVTIVKRDATSDCLRSLGGAEPWTHEVTLYRGLELVWQGPLWDYDETRSFIVLTARDALEWLSRRTVHQDLAWSGNAAMFAQTILTDALTPNDPGLLDYLDVQTLDSPWVQRETVQGNTTKASDQLEEAAAVGLDYYTLGRAINVRPDKVDYNVRAHRLQEKDFMSEFKVRKVGSEAATKAYVVGVLPQGSADWLPTPIGVFGGAVAGMGLIENVSNAANTSDAGALASMARRVVGYGSPVPVAVSLPANSGLAPDAPVTIHDLVPGRYFQVALTSYAVRVKALMKLNQVSATWTPDAQEKVSVSMIPKDVYDLPPAA